MYMRNRVIRWSQAHQLVHIFKDEKKVVVEKLNQLENAIYNLQYEGKLFSSSHIKKAEEAMRFLKEKFTVHIDLDNRVIFPFLEKHIPRLNSVLLYLKSERREFQEGFKIFEEILAKLKKENDNMIRHGIIERLKDKGIYLICLMRNHIQLEEQSVYKSLELELHKDERNILIEKIVNFSKRRN